VITFLALMFCRWLQCRNAAWASTRRRRASLHDLFDEYWEAQLREAPTFATLIGDTATTIESRSVGAGGQRGGAAQLAYVTDWNPFNEAHWRPGPSVAFVLLFKLRPWRDATACWRTATGGDPWFGHVTPVTQMDGRSFSGCRSWPRRPALPACGTTRTT